VIRRTGLSADVIRAWERRYGAVTPDRSGGGQRLYSEEDVRRLVLLQKATAVGHSIGEIATLDVRSLEALSANGASPSARGPDDSAAMVAEAIGATEELDQGALESLLKRAVLLLGASRFIDSVVSDFLRQVGDRWHAGTLAPFHEHLASNTVRRVLAWVTDAYELEAGSPAIVVATPAGELHELGALVVAAAAAEEGWRVVYLGADLRAADVVAATAQVGAELVALSVVYVSGDSATRELSETARALPHGTSVIVGGAAALRLGRDALGDKVQILDDIPALRRLLRARRHTRSVISGKRVARSD
jgi:MerR family transcriptional regulator, light-induced transcriptional regulator